MSAELVCSASDPAWLERRREGITATDIVTIAGLVTWDSPWALYHRKLGLLPEVEQSDRMWVGSMLEEAISDKWYRLGRGSKPQPGHLYRSATRPWQMATPDRVMYRNSFHDWDAVLECKTADRYQTGWGPDGSDEVPAHVRAQVLWQMDTLGVAAGHVAVVFLPSGEFRSYTIRHEYGHTHWLPTECAVCHEIEGLRTLGKLFWNRIEDKNPPPLDGLEVTTDALRYLHPAPGGTVDIGEGGAVAAYDMAAEAKRIAEVRFRKEQNWIREAMGDAHEATVDGQVVFRRTIGKRAGYTVQPAETDTLRRIGKDKHDASSES